MKLIPYSVSCCTTIFLFQVHPNVEKIYAPVRAVGVNTVQK
jgi:hypothetical protein